MARRSSARLRNRNSSTPKRVSLSHDAHVQTPRTAPVKLAALYENDEMPGAFPDSASPPPRFRPNATNFNNATPTNGTPVKPSEEEMHPKQHQQSTAKPLEEARWLGFSNMYPQTEPPKHNSRLATLQVTPTKASNKVNGAQSPKLHFAFNREQSLELSPAAKRLMEETRGEAAKIREQMIARGEASQEATDVSARRIATPKSRKGRYSDAHKAEFNKMDSIANHHSVKHIQPGGPLNISVNTPGQKSSQKTLFDGSPTKSLKRKQSRADLDEPDRYPKHNLPHSTGKVAAVPVTSQLPHPMSTNNLVPTKTDGASPAKRMKPTIANKSDAERATSQRSLPSTPQTSKVAPHQTHYPDLSSLASPTQASLARSASVNSKIPGPSLVRSPSKPVLQQHTSDSTKPSTPLLARSPSKATLFERGAIESPKTIASPLLMRSPTKPAISKKSREDDKDQGVSEVTYPPLLARSPLKVSVAKKAEPIIDDQMQNASSSTPLLHRSPAKMIMPASTAIDQTGSTPANGSGGGLMGRFQLLRSSPMKSILRSPQRLYSTDPAKVAAGTHLATPPKLGPDNAPAGTAQKRVDFSSSTKARYERAQSELSSTPSKSDSRSPSPKVQVGSARQPAPSFTAYPVLPSRDNEVIVTPQKRRQTAVPGDFTFKAGEHSISFGLSPNAPASTVSSKRPSTIRHVSTEPELLAQATGSKKRKFEYENAVVAGEEENQTSVSDKENESESERPAKRFKKSTPELPVVLTSKPAAKPAVTKRPTLGVKPKKSEKDGRDKKPSMISKARLAALSQPKRRA